MTGFGECPYVLSLLHKMKSMNAYSYDTSNSFVAKLKDIKIKAVIANTAFGV